MNNDTINWLLENAQSAYQAEREAQEKLRDRVAFISGLLITPLVGSWIYLAAVIKADLFSFAYILFFIVPLVLSGALLAAGVFIVLTVFSKGHSYDYPPLPSALSQYARGVANPEEALPKLKRNLLARYESAIDHNASQNVSRSNRLLTATRLAVASLPLVAIAGFHHFAVSATAKAQPLHVELVRHVPGIQESANEPHEACPRLPSGHPHFSNCHHDTSTTAGSGPGPDVSAKPLDSRPCGSGLGRHRR